MTGFNIWQFIGGITVFVYAMSLIETSLKSLAGRSFKKFLQKNAQSKIKMTIATTVATGLLQSSSIVLLIVLSFVGAGLINLQGALAATLGANIGTTLSSWIIALVGFKIDLFDLAFPVLGLTLVVHLIDRKKDRLAYFTRFLMGLALIFIGLEWLKNCVDPSLAQKITSYANLHYIFFIPIGFLLTAIVQSSSVTVAITLSALFNNLIPFESACGIVLGSELGTTLKFLIGSIGGIADKKRVAWGNFMINFLTMAVAVILLKPMLFFISDIIKMSDPFTSLVLFQSGINILALIIFYPLVGTLAASLEKYIIKSENENLTLYINKNVGGLPGDALELSRKEILHLMNETILLNELNFGIKSGKKIPVHPDDLQIVSGSYSFQENYLRIKTLHGEILEYLSELPKDEMNDHEIEQMGKQITILRHLLRSAKNLKDIRHNLNDFDASINDDIFNLSAELKEKAKTFYGEFLQLLSHDAKISVDKLNALLEVNRKQYDLEIALTLNKLKENKISELDTSNIINVYREIYSSNKALISSLRDIEDIEDDN